MVHRTRTQWGVGLPFHLKEAAMSIRFKEGHKTLNDMVRKVFEDYLQAKGVNLDEFSTDKPKELTKGEISLLKTLLEKAERPPPVSHWQPHFMDSRPVSHWQRAVYIPSTL